MPRIMPHSRLVNFYLKKQQPILFTCEFQANMDVSCTVSRDPSLEVYFLLSGEQWIGRRIGKFDSFQMPWPYRLDHRRSRKRRTCETRLSLRSCQGCLPASLLQVLKHTPSVGWRYRSSFIQQRLLIWAIAPVCGATFHWTVSLLLREIFSLRNLDWVEYTNGWSRLIKL